MATRIGDTYYFTLDEINRGCGGGGSDDAVLYTPQTLSPSEQAQARQNIGAEAEENKTTVITESSTDTEYPSAKAVYTLVSSSGGGQPQLTMVIGDSQDGTKMHSGGYLEIERSNTIYARLMISPEISGEVSSCGVTAISIGANDNVYITAAAVDEPDPSYYPIEISAKPNTEDGGFCYQIIYTLYYSDYTEEKFAFILSGEVSTAA